MYYQSESFLTTPIGNNAIDFQKRKKIGSDSILRIPPMIEGTLDDVQIVTGYGSGVMSQVSYEYISDSGKLISAHGLENLLEIKPVTRNPHPSTYIIDNHNHAFYCRYKSYLEGHLPRGSHLIHIDQHSDLNEVSESNKKYQEVSKSKNTIETLLLCTYENFAPLSLSTIATYTNEVLDIASFIKPAKACGLISDYEMILTEYSLLHYPLTPFAPFPLIVDIDLDFRAHEMSIAHYEQTIRQVKKLIALPQTKCVTIATSPTYIDQHRALEILRDILE